MNNPTPESLQVDAQRAALAEARHRIIARYEHVDNWLKQPLPYDTRANWEGITEGLRQARRIIGAMWDDLPISIPLATDAQTSGQECPRSSPDTEAPDAAQGVPTANLTNE